jgi:hypothetical protein
VNFVKSISAILHSLPLWERRMSYCPRPGAYCQAQDSGAMNIHSLSREAQTWLDGDSTVLKLSTNGRVGVGRRNWLLHRWVRTPPRKIRSRFRGCKHTSLGFLGGEFRDVERSYSPKMVNFLTLAPCSPVRLQLTVSKGVRAYVQSAMPLRLLSRGST